MDNPKIDPQFEKAKSLSAEIIFEGDTLEENKDEELYDKNEAMYGKGTSAAEGATPMTTGKYEVELGRKEKREEEMEVSPENSKDEELWDGDEVMYRKDPTTTQTASTGSKGVEETQRNRKSTVITYAE